MLIHIRVDSMKAAEALSGICKEYPCEMLLKSDRYCIDPKSLLGVLAMMYSARESMCLDTNDMEADAVPRFLAAIEAYRVPEEA